MRNENNNSVQYFLFRNKKNEIPFIFIVFIYEHSVINLYITDKSVVIIITGNAIFLLLCKRNLKKN